MVPSVDVGRGLELPGTADLLELSIQVRLTAPSGLAGPGQAAYHTGPGPFLRLYRVVLVCDQWLSDLRILLIQ